MGIHQVCGPDGSRLTFAEGDTGVIVIDPWDGGPGLCPRPVSAVIAVGRMGGVGQVGDVPVLAPAGMSLPPPTIDITRSGQEETVDGVGLVCQLTAAGMNVFFPAHEALYLGGISVPRDLADAIAMFGDRAEVVFSSSQRPVRGRSNIMVYLLRQRDAHAYLHDQTLRLLGKGHTGDEIAELIQLPPVLAASWHAGPVERHVKQIYQCHVGGFDDPWPPPAPGGSDDIVATALGFVDDGDLRFAAQLLRQAVSSGGADLLAQVYERLGHNTEEAAWRDFYLTGARELRQGFRADPGPVMACALPPEQIFAAVAIRVDAGSAWHETIVIDWVLDDGPYRTVLRHGVLTHHAGGGAEPADLTVRLTKPQLLELLGGQSPCGVGFDGDPAAVRRLLAHLDGLARA